MRSTEDYPPISRLLGCLREPLVDGVEEGVFSDGFGQVVGAACGQASLDFFLEGMGGQGDDGGGFSVGGFLPFPDRSGGGMAVHLGHLHVHQHQVVVLGPVHVDGDFSCFGGFQLVAGLFEVGPDEDLVVG